MAKFPQLISDNLIDYGAGLKYQDVWLGPRNHGILPEDRIKAGQGFVVSTKRQNMGIGTQYFRCQIKNPVGSGKNIYIYNIVAVNGSPDAVWADVIVNSSTSITSNPIVPTNVKFADPTVSAGTVYWDISANPMAGTSKVQLYLEAAARNKYAETIFVLSPGLTLGIFVNFPNNTDTAMFNAYWWEETI